MRYLVTHFENNRIKAFFTHWFEVENNFNPETKMVVFDLAKCKFTTDGKIWNDIEVDHL